MKSNLHTDEDLSANLVTMNLDPRLSKLINKYQEVFGVLPEPLSSKEKVQMDLKLKPDFEGLVVRRYQHPAAIDQIEET